MTAHGSGVARRSPTPELSASAPGSSLAHRWPRLTPAMALTLVVAAFLLMGTGFLLGIPPWETPDESAHVGNVETLLSGHLYRMAPGNGTEAVQPPLYYLALAGWQQLWGFAVRKPAPVDSHSCQLSLLLGHPERCWSFRHNTRADGGDRRLVRLLRFPGLLLGALAVVMTALVARRLSSDRWTPVIAAATLASVPSFMLDSVGVNNDTLANGLAALATWLAILAADRCSARGRLPVALVVGLGAVFGALVQTKLTTLTLAPAILLAVIALGGAERRSTLLTLVFAGSALAVAGWWLVRSTSLYGQPLGLSAVSRYNHLTGPLEYVNLDPLYQVFVALPRMMWKQFWYGSRLGSPAWAYLPFWGLAWLSLVGAARRWRDPQVHRIKLAILLLFALGAFASVWIVGVQDTAAQARLAFIGLPAIACLIALGFEQLAVPRFARLVLPVLGFAGTSAALIVDVLTIPA